MLATSKGTNADSDEALKAPELAQESAVTVPLILLTSVFPAGSKNCNNQNLLRSSSNLASMEYLLSHEGRSCLQKKT